MAAEMLVIVSVFYIDSRREPRQSGHLSFYRDFLEVPQNSSVCILLSRAQLQAPTYLKERQKKCVFIPINYGFIINRIIRIYHTTSIYSE